MRTLTPAERRQFRAKAHHLHPFVSIGQHGLTPAVLHEIDVNLLAHELIKIRVSGDDRGAREALLERICAELDAAPVQHLGKILTIWRPAPAPEAPVARTRAAPRGREVKAGRPAPRGIEPRSRSVPAGPRARTKAQAAPESRRRKPAPQGGRAATFKGDGTGGRKPAPQGGRAATFKGNATGGRKPAPQGGRAATFKGNATGGRKPAPQGGRAATFEGDATGGRRRAGAPPAAGARRRRTTG